MSHLRRPQFAARFPVHVTLRVVRGLPSLEQMRCVRAIRRSFVAGNERFGVRLVHFAVLGNHLHLICEAAGAPSLSRGMQGLSIRVAKALNRLLQRRGRVLADRYHARVLRTPTQARHAVQYVLRNHEHHFGAGAQGVTSVWFPEATVAARTWLLARAIAAG